MKLMKCFIKLAQVQGSPLALFCVRWRSPPMDASSFRHFLEFSLRWDVGKRTQTSLRRWNEQRNIIIRYFAIGFCIYMKARRASVPCLVPLESTHNCLWSVFLHSEISCTSLLNGGSEKLHSRQMWSSRDGAIHYLFTRRGDLWGNVSHPSTDRG